MQIKAIRRYHYAPIRWLKLQLDSTSADGNAENYTTRTLLVRLQNGSAALGNSLPVSHGIEHLLTRAIPLLGFCPREIKIFNQSPEYKCSKKLYL